MILYNGASGGLGRHLAGLLGDTEEPSHALAARLEAQSALQAELSSLDPGGKVTFIQLAARVSVPACEADPLAAHSTNVFWTRNTTETVINWATECGAAIRVIYVSSGHVYAAQPKSSRLHEHAPIAPRSVYAQTKWKAEVELRSLASARDVPLLVARVFGLLAPRQAPNYVLPALIQRARIGNLEGVPGLDFARDYLDARDVCQDLLLLAAARWPDPSFVVNVCSGVAVTIRDLLRAILEVIDPERANEAAKRATAAPGRPDDIRWLVGDPRTFTHLTGSVPQRIPLSHTVADAVASVE